MSQTHSPLYRLTTLSGSTEEMECQGRHASSIVVDSGLHQVEQLCASALELSLGRIKHPLNVVRRC